LEGYEVAVEKVGQKGGKYLHGRKNLHIFAVQKAMTACCEGSKFVGAKSKAI